MTAVTGRPIKSVSYSLRVHCLQPPADSRCIASLSCYPQHDGLAIVATTVLLPLPRAIPRIIPFIGLLPQNCVSHLIMAVPSREEDSRHIVLNLNSGSHRSQDLSGFATPCQIDCSSDWSLCAIAHAHRVKFTIFDTHTHTMTSLIRQSPIRSYSVASSCQPTATRPLQYPL